VGIGFERILKIRKGSPGGWTWFSPRSKGFPEKS